MDFKSYDNSWIPGSKGVLFFILGIIAFLQSGTFETLTLFIVVLIFLIGMVFLAFGFFDKSIKNKIWTITKGFLHFGFAIWLAINLGADNLYAVRIIVLWLIFSSVNDGIEAILMFRDKNILGFLFVINIIPTLVLAFFINKIVQSMNFDQDVLYNLGVVEVMTGLIMELTAFILLRSKRLPE